MIVLVANLGSTSFKYKLFEMPSERVLAVGAADRIGQGGSAWELEIPEREPVEGQADLPDHKAAIDLHLEQLVKAGILSGIGDLQAVGFKAVHGGPISGAVVVDDAVLETMDRFSDVAPAHNPPYIAAMKSFAELAPTVPRVAAFETGFHQSIPLARQVYAIPWEWTEAGVRRYGFHGASHRYIATRMAQIDPTVRRIVSLHLGGSCSVCAIKDGQSQAHSMGLTPQTGVFHNNRVGDFDIYALLKLLDPKAGQDVDTILKRLSKEGGLLGISGLSPDMRDVREAALKGHERAKLALEAFIETCRHYLGAYLAVLGGVDAVVFTAGIGQHEAVVRSGVCREMGFAGIELDEAKNTAANGKQENALHAEGAKVQIWALPTNEELIVARQTVEALNPA